VKTRVLVVDDSAVIRRMLGDILTADPDIELAGTAANATLALAKIQQERPDVVTLDVEMPDVSGLELLVQIRKLDPRLPVIMFSSLTQRAAATTLEALSLGATDYVTKPSGTGSREASIEMVRAQLLPKIKALARRGTAPRTAVAATEKPYKPANPARKRERVDLVAIGSSTGGPNALAELFRGIPANFPVPIVVVQHMPPVFTALLAQRLTSTCPLTFHEARDGERLVPGHVWIAPGDFHMPIRRDGTAMKIGLNQQASENSCRPSVDVLFRSVAAVNSANTLAVMLTGMGSDGLQGCELIHAAGGQIVVQDEASSVVWGMPGFVAKAGLADRVLPLTEMAGEMMQRTARRETAGPAAQSGVRHVG
jgi:two-component system chemotaxis response regulator CheB